MAKRMALISEDLLTSQHLRKPEIRIEDDMVELMERGNLPDDMKVKLLSQLIMRYQKSVHEPPEPVRVTIADNKTVVTPNKDETSADTPSIITDDKIMKDILASSPRPYWKYIPMIVDKLKTRMYSWNENGEFTVNNAAVKNSSVADFFSYLLRNVKTQKQPIHFEKFLRAIEEINIPVSWIGNKNVMRLLKSSDVETSDTPSSKRKFPERLPSSSSPQFKITPISKRLNLSLPIENWDEI